MKKSLSILLTFVMFCSMILRFDNVVYAKEVEGDVITEARVTNGEGVPFKPGEKIGAWVPFRIYAEFELPDNVVKENDTVTMTLPIGFDTAPPDHFDIKDSDGNLIAKATLHNQNPAKIVLTYTKYAETHSGVKGKFYFNVRVNRETQTGSGELPVTLTVNGKIIPAGKVDYNPPTFVSQQLTKGGWMTSDKTKGKYEIRLNQNNVVLTNAKFIDTIQSDNVEFDENSIQIFQGQWENKITEMNFNNRKDVTKEFKDAGKIKFEGKKLTIDIGSIGAENINRGFYILYEVKLKYDPLAGEEIKNKATLTYGGGSFKKESTYKIKDAGGTGGGYQFTIKVLKTGKDNKSLAGAKFDVIRVRNKQKVGEIVTGQDGSGEIGKLLRDEYQLVETEAPKGYQKLKDPITVNPADFGDNKIALKNIKNEPDNPTPSTEKTSVSVEKKWVGAVGNSIIAQIKKEGDNTVIQEHAITATDNWTYEFKDLDKYESDGVTQINYQVVEKDVPEGYTVSYEKDSTGTLIIKNTKKTTIEKISVKVTKKWKDKDNNDLNAPVEKIEVELYKDGAATGTKLELTKADNWTGEFKKLPVSATIGGKIHEYTVKEIGESGNAIQLVGKWYGVTYGGTMKDGLTVTNKEKNSWTPMVPPTRDLKVTKVWQNDSGTEIVPSVDEITVELYKDGVATGNKKELIKKNNWTATFEKLPVSETLGGKNYEYTIKEVGANGEKIELAGTWYKVSYGGTMVDGFVITNEKEVKPEKPDKPDKPDKPTSPGGTTPPGGTVPPSGTTPPDNPTQLENSTQTDKATKLNHSSKEKKTTLLKKIAQSGRHLPKTGDGANPAVYALALFALGTVLTTVGYRRRKNVN